MQIVLVRHGEPDWEPGGVAVDEPELTRFGHSQAERAALALAARVLRRALREPAAARARDRGADRACPRPRAHRGLLAARARTAAPRRQDRGGGAELLRVDARARPREAGGRACPAASRSVTSTSASRRASRASWSASTACSSTRTRVTASGGCPSGTGSSSSSPTRAPTRLIVSHLLGIEPTPWEWMRFSSRWAGIARLRTAPVASGAVWVLESFNEQRAPRRPLGRGLAWNFSNSERRGGEGAVARRGGGRARQPGTSAGSSSPSFRHPTPSSHVCGGRTAGGSGARASVGPRRSRRQPSNQRAEEAGSRRTAPRRARPGFRLAQCRLALSST